MSEQIAILCHNRQPATLHEADTILIFELDPAGSWLERKAFPFHLTSTPKMDALRDQIRDLITRLGTCRIIAGQAINGLAYHVLDRMRLAIFEIRQIDTATLNQILQDVQQAAPPDTAEDMPRHPVCTGDGIYYLDFIRLQKLHPEISSKKALQSFLQHSPFIKLNILCSHVPLWLKNAEYKQAYTQRTKKYGDSLLLSLSPKTCQEQE